VSEAPRLSASCRRTSRCSWPSASPAHDARTGSRRSMAKEVPGPTRADAVVFPGFELTGRPRHAWPFADVVPGFFDYLVEEGGLRPAQLLAELLGSSTPPMQADAPVFRSATGQALTRFGIYKIVRRHAGQLDDARAERWVSPHTFLPHRGGARPRSRRRGQRHPRLAGTRRPHHHKPLRQRRSTPRQGARRFGTPSLPVLRRDHALVRSGDRTKRYSAGCHPSDRYVAGADRSTPSIWASAIIGT
jgi:hypothetical protein